MAENRSPDLVLENRHTGERLTLRRVKRGDEVWLEVKGSLPPRSEGPPLHIHFEEHEEGRVTSGTFSAVVDGHRITAGPGETAVLPRGSAHRWWNAGNNTLEVEGYVRPLVDFDRFLQAVFEVVNAGPKGRPPVFYMARSVSSSPYARTVADATTDPSRDASNHCQYRYRAWALPRR